MALVKRFEELQVWQEARKLANAVYDITSNGEFRRDYGLVDQVRRASVSIMNNVVEGFDSGSTAEFIRFLGYAKRSGSEVQSCLYLALDQQYLTEKQFQELYVAVEGVRKFNLGLIRYLRCNRTPSGRHPGTPAPRHPGTQEPIHASN